LYQDKEVRKKNTIYEENIFKDSLLEIAGFYKCEHIRLTQCKLREAISSLDCFLPFDASMNWTQGSSQRHLRLSVSIMIPCRLLQGVSFGNLKGIAG
jgi:hypothetical protein